MVLFAAAAAMLLLIFFLSIHAAFVNELKDTDTPHAHLSPIPILSLVIYPYKASVFFIQQTID